MDIKRIRQFAAVADLGTFGRAARALYLTQPSLTRNIRSLETEMGAQLFERGPRGAQLTPAGQKFLPRARFIINEFDRALGELDPSRIQESEQVRLGISPNFLSDIVPTVVADGLKLLPSINVRVQTATFGTLMTLLRASEIDLALCLAPDFTGTRGTEMLDLNFESLGRETVVPVAPANHPVLQGPATLAQLAGYGWTLPYQVSVVYRFESAFHRQGLDIPIQNLNATTPELVKQVSINAGLLTMLPLRMIQNDIDSGALVILPTPELRFEYLVALITLPKKLTESSQRFAGFLRDYAKTW